MLKKFLITLICLIIAGFLIINKFYPELIQNLDKTKGTSEEKASGSLEQGKIVASKELPRLGPPGDYKPQGDTVDVELSVWPGYAPLIVANGGLNPNPDSYFFRKYGFKLKIAISEAEAEAWQAINSGKNAISATTVDVLALYANQLKVEVPIQLDFSRGGDGILTRKEINSINQLKGKVLTVAQFTESDFFIRFLAQEAGLQVKPLKGLKDPIDPERVNLLFTETAFDAADAFVESVEKGDQMISGAVTWSPKTIEVPKAYPDKIKLLTSNRNLLVVADILIVNAGFARQNPKIMKGLVEGILMGVEMIRKDPENTLPVVAKAFNMSLEELRESLQDVHLSNHAENLLFFSSEPGQIGSFNELYYSAVYAYGKEVIKDVVAPEKLVNKTYLEELAREGLFQGQTVELAPIKSTEKAEALERNPLLTKQIRFYFDPNTSSLDLTNPTNQQTLKDLATLLKISPGSYLLLRGHLDNTKVEEFKQKGEAFYRKQAVRAVEMSKQRAESVKATLVKNYPIDPKRIDTEGRGWDEPLPGAQPEENRRVEVQLFTLE
ncbi:MAG TPA: phosphate ABC transporter substrate-binding/OmpA family protein [Candidatus Limnocylindrales bacterium]|nr:phosphate ABC transporter substrate-binding/OmpA family protein [Candidatus Limnocylindrales bacterium]